MWIAIGLIVVLIVLCFLGIEFMLSELKDIKLNLQKINCSLNKLCNIGENIEFIHTAQQEIGFELKSLSEKIRS